MDILRAHRELQEACDARAPCTVQLVVAVDYDEEDDSACGAFTCSALYQKAIHALGCACHRRDVTSINASKLTVTGYYNGLDVALKMTSTYKPFNTACTGGDAALMMAIFPGTTNDKKVIADLRTMLRDKPAMDFAKTNIGIVRTALALAQGDEKIAVKKGTALHEAIDALGPSAIVFDPSGCDQAVDCAALLARTKEVEAFVAANPASQLVPIDKVLRFELKLVALPAHSGCVVVNMELELA